MNTVKGIYRNGHVELSEPTDAVEGTEVVITFPLDPTRRSTGRGGDQTMIRPGELAVKGRPMSRSEDFDDAEYRPDLKDFE